MRRAIVRFFFVTLLGILAMVLGVITSMTLTPPGRDLLARNVSALLDRIVQGSVEVGYISGSFLYDLTLKRLVVRDTAGVLLAEIPRVRVGYRLSNLLAGDIVLSSVTLDQPVIQLIKHRSGRMNYEEVLGIGKGAPGGTSPLVEFDDVRINDGTLRIVLPWNPAGSLVTEQARDSALAAERAKPGRVIEGSPEGLRRVITFHDLTTAMSRLRITTPDRQPFTIDLDSLATRVSDPGVTITDAVGRVRFHGDSAIISLSRGALPGTVVSGGGTVTWPQDTVLFDFELVSPQVDLTDLRWVSPKFPAMTGSGTLAAHSVSGARTEYVIRELRLEDGPQRIAGDLVAIADKQTGLAVRDMDLELSQLDLDVARAYLDSLPFYGTLSGTVAGQGDLNDLQLLAHWDFVDARAPGQPTNHIDARGRVLTGPRGLTFDSVAVRSSDIALGTVRQLARAVPLRGRLEAAGILDGPLRNATFIGRIRHQDGSRPASIINGLVRLDTRRDTLSVETDVTLDPLSFAGIRTSFPSLKAEGELYGQFAARGTLGDLTIDAELRGGFGAVHAAGGVTILPPVWGADSLRLRFSDLNLAALRGTGPPTSLFGSAVISGVIDTLHAPEGEVHLSLDGSRIREWTIDSVFTDVAVHDGMIRLDTLYAAWKGAVGRGSGTLGWASPHDGTMRFTVAADSLVAFDSLLLAATGLTRDTAAAASPLDGSARLSLQVQGSLDSLAVGGDGVVHDLQFQALRAGEVAGTFEWSGGDRPAIAATIRSDSISVARWTFREAGFDASGWADSLSWGLGTGIGSETRIDGTGRWWQTARDSVAVVAFDTLSVGLISHTWRLTEPVEVTLRPAAPSLTPLQLRAADGTGLLTAVGTLPGDAPGDLTLDVFGIDLRDAYLLLRRDTLGVSGEVAANLHVGGTARAPTLRGTTSLGEIHVGDVALPFLQAAVDYADRRLDANVLLWKTGEPVLEVSAQLPIDLGLRGVEKRQLNGPLTVRARADSVDLAILGAVAPGLEGVGGRLAANVQVTGTWEDPRLAGFAEVREAALSLPSLGVRFDSIGGRAELAGDSVVLRNVRLASGGGELNVDGTVRLENLSRPILDLHLGATRFQAIDDPSFLSLSASGRMNIRGPFYGATVTGAGTAREGALYFADLVNKQIIDLDDPLIADLVDTTLIRSRNLGDRFQTRFLEELKVDDFLVDIGDDFWLRSNEANIKLNGELRVNKVENRWRLDGTLNAERGSYTLRIGPVTRDFTVERGTVRYFGTPDLNAELNVEARRNVRPVGGSQDIPLTAKITGTLLAPRLDLSSPQNPALSETDLISYLVFGVPSSEALALGQGAALRNAGTLLSTAAGAVTSEIERALIADLNLPVDLIEIRPGFSQGSLNSSALTQVAAGWQIGRTTFVTLTAGLCPGNRSLLSYRNFGASLQLRASAHWRLQTSIEPTLRSCTNAVITDQIPTTYQFGADLLWEREF